MSALIFYAPGVKSRAFYIYLQNINEIVMTKDINRIKVVLTEKKRTNKWLVQQLGKDPATISKWCTNTLQPILEKIVEIAQILDVKIQDLVKIPEREIKTCPTIL